jgi:hypothetical protein
MAERRRPDGPDSAGSDWERHRREQLRRIVRETTPAQRLAWLEEAIEFARRAGALPPSLGARRTGGHGDVDRSEGPSSPAL